MEQRLKDVLAGQEGNYLLPFFWQHGEEEALLREGMEKIRESGIRAVCVESRPHPDYVGEKWWADMDIIMEEARKRDMRVWVLDDAHFPSGYCNGKITEDSPYGKLFLDYYHIDVCGPAVCSGFWVQLDEGETLLAATAGLRDKEDTEKITQVIDLTAYVKKGILYWDVPPGYWLVTIIKTTHKGKVRPGYINVIDREAVRFFIDTVYEPHYAHYREEFGKIFAGFFSDEPELGNVVAHQRIGCSDAPLPWCNQLEKELKELWKESYGIKLTALFCRVEAISPAARVEFMDRVTGLYHENFCNQIGEWCRQRGVEYIGHVIEDNGCHARMGLGTGHFFRTLWGQDMSGIDVVLQQIRPGFSDRSFHNIGGKTLYDGKFFQFALAKMGSSLGHMDEKKKGRTMCEMFGAYGWAEGLKLMKWLTDHMLVRGVNYFVPHAFTMKDFPDPDCPPHFYARGRNPQYPYFRYLMEYTNRVSHLINGGEHVPNVAVFYNACAEWAGEYEPVENVGMVLAREQIDYEIVPEDVLCDCKVTGGKLLVGKEECSALIFPYCEYLPEYLVEWCRKAAKQGLTIIFRKQAPKGLESGIVFSCPDVEIIQDECMSEEENTGLISRLRELGIHEIVCEQSSSDLRYYHYRQGKGDFYLFFNESVEETVDTMIQIPMQGSCCVFYDAFDNQLRKAQRKGDKVYLRLEPSEACILYVGDVEQEWQPEEKQQNGIKAIDVAGNWKLCLQQFDGKLVEAGAEISELSDITHPDRYPDFSGTMEYEITFDVGADYGELLNCDRIKIDFGDVYETMEAWLNGESLGVRIAPPYVLDGRNCLKEKGNLLRIRVINTLVHHERDVFSKTMPVEPSGLFGPVKVIG